jgi:serine/threonine-protein kinase
MATAAPDHVVPARLEAVVRRAMARQPGDRFASASDLAAALRGVESPDGGAAARWAAASALLALAVAVGVGWALR